MIVPAPERLQLIGAGALHQGAFGRFAVEPGQEPRQRRAVAPVRCPDAVDLDGGFYRLRQLARIVAAIDDGVGLLQAVEHP